MGRTNGLIAHRHPLIADRRGYSLIELSLAITIFVMLTALVIVNFDRGRRSNDLRQAALILAQDFRTMQANALAGQVVNGNVPKGFGVHLSKDGSGSPPNNTLYTLFADVDGCERYNSLSPSENDTVLALRTLPMNVTISNFTTDLGNSPATLDVNFSPPQSVTYLNAVCSTGAASCFPTSGCPGTLGSGSSVPPFDSTVTVTLTNIQIGQSRTVTVNRLSGQVSVQ